MKKEDLQIFIKALVPSIKKMIRSESKKIVQSMIKEEVENQVNRILAEQFIQTIGNNKRSLMEDSSVSEMIGGGSAQKTRTKNEKALSEQRRNDIRKKLGIDEEPTLGMIYGDMDQEEVIQESRGVGSYDDPLEDDDDGVDLSAFGY